ncbi:TVP38/TMEM64 family protein [Tropicimonas sp.]|uniref:TVP38/TMEM64 family protein n=1 Tax=Tropicimonas sp. TaxID=2067044 RepID=UPI003A897CF2
MTKQGSGTRLRVLPLILIGLAAATGAVTLRGVLSFEALAENQEALLAFRDAHVLVTTVSFVLAYAAVVALSLPGATAATLAGGFLFGVFPGALLNVTGASLGAIGIFLAARQGVGTALAARMDAADGRIRRFKDGIDANQWEMLFLIRLVLLVPFFVANLLPALVGVPLRRYAITTVLGIAPAAIVYTSLGAGLGKLIAAGEAPDPGVIFSPPVLLPILGLCALAALPMILRALRRDDSR